jgi:hypothetical protein
MSTQWQCEKKEQVFFVGKTKTHFLVYFDINLHLSRYQILNESDESWENGKTTIHMRVECCEACEMMSECFLYFLLMPRRVVS